MAVSTRFAVGTHVLAALAISQGRPVPSERLASSASTHPAVVRSLLSRLARAALTKAELGPGGGALLARSPEQITLLDVYNALEDRDLFPLHRTPPDRNCFVGRHVQEVLGPHMASARKALEAELASVTIADLAREIIGRARSREATT